MKRDKDNNILLTPIEFNDLCTNTRKSEREMIKKKLKEQIVAVCECDEGIDLFFEGLI